MPGRGLAEPTYTQSVASFPSLLAYHALLNTLCSVARSYPTLCNPMDCSLPGSSIRGILQARRLEWVSRSSSRLSSQPRSWTWVPRCLLALTDRFFTTEILYLGNLTRYNPFLQIAPLAPRWWTKYIPSNTISSLGNLVLWFFSLNFLSRAISSLYKQSSIQKFPTFSSPSFSSYKHSAVHVTKYW